MSAIMAFCIVCFMTLFGMLIIRLIGPKRRISHKEVENRLREEDEVVASENVQEEDEESYLQKLNKRLKKADVGITVPIYFGIILVSAAIIFIVMNYLTENVVVSLIACLPSVVVPPYVMDFLVKRKMKKFDTMFVKALKRMSGSLRAKETLEEAMRGVVESEMMPEEIRKEFEIALSDYSFDGDMTKAFMGIYKRTGNDDVKGVALGVAIAEKFGSNVGEVFENYTAAIIDRKEMEAEGDAILSGTKMNTNIICAIPFIFSGVMKLSQPEYFDSAYQWMDGLGTYIIVALYAVVIAGWLFLLKKCDIKL